MIRMSIMGSLTFVISLMGCGVPDPSGPSGSDVRAGLGGEYEIKALFNDGATAYGWPQYEGETEGRVNVESEYVIEISDETGGNSVAGYSAIMPLSHEESGASRLDDLRLNNSKYQLRISFHSHRIGSCINQSNVWHANVAFERYGVSSPDSCILNIHLAAWRNENQKCLGILVNGNKGEELYCKAFCSSNPTQQEIRDMITAAMVATGVAMSVTAGWIANTAAPVLRPVLVVL